MFTIYIYVLDTLADWELGHVISELNSGRFFKKNQPRLGIKMVSYSKEPITTMGGLEIVPNCTVEEIEVSQTSLLLLPGADTWNEPTHGAVIEKARELLLVGATVGAICGATNALADGGLLDQREHTSNGVGYLELFSPNYQGQRFYIDAPAVMADNLITASSTGALLWAKLIISRLNVFQRDTLDCWYDYFSTGETKHFYALMETLPSYGATEMT